MDKSFHDPDFSLSCAFQKILVPLVITKMTFVIEMESKITKRSFSVGTRASGMFFCIFSIKTIEEYFLLNVFRSESENLSSRFREEHLTKNETDRQPEERTVNTEFIGPFPSGVQKSKKNRDKSCFYNYFTQLTTLWEHSQITSTNTFDMGKEGSKFSKMG